MASPVADEVQLAEPDPGPTPGSDDPPRSRHRLRTTLIVVGVLLWLVNSYIPMDAKIKNILNIVVVIIVVLWLLQAFGVLGSLGGMRVG